MDRSRASGHGFSAAAALVTATLALVPAAHAQSVDTDVRTLIKTGDTLSSGESVFTLLSASIGDNGRWTATGSLDGDVTNNGLIIDGELALKTGDAAPGGGTVQFIRSAKVSNDGVVSVLYAIENPANPANSIGRLQIGNQFVLEEGDSISIPIAGVSGTIQEFYCFDYEAPILSAGIFVQQPGAPNVRLFFTGRLLGSTLTIANAIVEGDAIAGASAGSTYLIPGSTCQSRDQLGACHPFTFFDGAANRQGLLAHGQLVAEDGQPGPAPNSEWNFDLPGQVRINNAGETLYSGQLTLSNGIDRGVVYLDGTPIAVEGGGLNGVLGGVVDEFHTASIALAEDGTPFFTVPLTTSGAQVLMAGSEIVLRAGPLGTPVGGTTIDSLYATIQGQSFDVTTDGRTVVQRARLATGRTAILLAERQVGDPVSCTAEPNSTGQTGTIRAVGSRFLAVNDLSIVASRLPLASFGYLAVSASSTFVAMPGGSSGNLCIGPTVGRYVDQVSSSGSTGEITTVIDLTAIPQPTGFVGSVAGDTWYFQLWHRDASMGTPTSNFTEAVSVTVQ